jgi:hypothetical protein
MILSTVPNKILGGVYGGLCGKKREKFYKSLPLWGRLGGGRRVITLTLESIIFKKITSFPFFAKQKERESYE